MEATAEATLKQQISGWLLVRYLRCVRSVHLEEDQASVGMVSDAGVLFRLEGKLAGYGGGGAGPTCRYWLVVGDAKYFMWGFSSRATWGALRSDVPQL